MTGEFNETMYVLRSSIGLLITASAVVATLSGCGQVDEKDKPREARPPAETSVRAAITDDGVHISPASIGGGPIRLIFANLTTKPVRGSIAGADDDRRRTRKPVPPGSTATINTILEEGTYQVLAGSGDRRAAELVVDAERPSSDGDLFLP